jgi:hypothetical protein
MWTCCAAGTSPHSEHIIIASEQLAVIVVLMQRQPSRKFFT